MAIRFHFSAVLARHPPGSITCIHVILSFITALCHLFSSSSSETPNISKPFSLCFLYSLTKSRLAERHGPHHDAQKSSSTTLPFKDDSEIESPFKPGKVI